MSTTRCGFARYMVARILLVWYPPPSYELSQLAKLLPFFVPNLLATTQRNTKSYFPRLKQCTLYIIHILVICVTWSGTVALMRMRAVPAEIPRLLTPFNRIHRAPYLNKSKFATATCYPMDHALDDFLKLEGS